eukprot:3920705-Rhodomonas_salina.5
MAQLVINVLSKLAAARVLIVVRVSFGPTENRCPGNCRAAVLPQVGPGSLSPLHSGGRDRQLVRHLRGGLPDPASRWSFARTCRRPLREKTSPPCKLCSLNLSSSLGLSSFLSSSPSSSTSTSFSYPPRPLLSAQAPTPQASPPRLIALLRFLCAGQRRGHGGSDLRDGVSQLHCEITDKNKRLPSTLCARVRMRGRVLVPACICMSLARSVAPPTTNVTALGYHMPRCETKDQDIPTPALFAPASTCL